MSEPQNMHSPKEAEHEPKVSSRKLWLNRLLCAVMLVLVLTLAGYFRFTGLFERGIFTKEPDSWKFVHTAAQWTEGEFTWIGGDSFYRPSIHLYHAAAFSAFGMHHWSIKLVNAVVDMLSLVLMFIIATLLSRNAWAGILTVILYAFVPNVIRSVWLEQHNSPATFLILLSLFLYICAMRVGIKRSIRYSCLAVSGFSLAVAANMHPDIAFFGPAFILCMLVDDLIHIPFRKVALVFVSGAAVFTASFFSVYLLGIIHFGWEEFARVFMKEHGFHTTMYLREASDRGFVESVVSTLTTLVQGVFQTTLVLTLFWGSLALAVISPLYGAKPKVVGYVAPILLLVYFALFAHLIGNLRFWRAIEPVVPLILICVVYWFHCALKPILRPPTMLLLMPLGIWVVFFNAHMTPAQAGQGDFAPDRYPRIYAILKEKVNQDQKLLVLPAVETTSMFADPETNILAGFASPVYFGTNALYPTGLRDFSFPYGTNSLVKAAKENNVRYVYVAKRNHNVDRVLMISPEFQVFDQGISYSVSQEMAIIEAFLKRCSAKRIADIEGRLYELPVNILDVEAPSSAKASLLSDFEYTIKIPLERFAGRGAYQAVQRAGGGIALSSDLSVGKAGGLVIDNFDIEIDDIQGYWVICYFELTTPQGIVHVPPAYVWSYWSHSGDYKENEWPFSANRRCRLGQVDSQHPFLFAGGLTRFDDWKGTLSDMRLTFTPPPAESARATKSVLYIEQIGFYGPLADK